LIPIFTAPTIKPKTGSASGWVYVNVDLGQHPLSVIPPPSVANSHAETPGEPATGEKRKRKSRSYVTDIQKRIVMYVAKMMESRGKTKTLKYSCDLFSINNVVNAYKWKALFNPPAGTVFGHHDSSNESRPLEEIERVQDWSTLSECELVILYESNKSRKLFEKV
jgi:hypothetical protein